MRRVAHLGAVAGLLAGPTALAFFSGGYFDEPRLVAGIAAWGLVALAAVVAPVPLPASTPGRLALGGLALLCGWTALSLDWAPIAGRALDDLQRLLLYLAALAAAAALLRVRGARRAVEPALAAGILVVIGYGLSERFLPGLIELDRSLTAGGRLEQPLTYWNAIGATAAIGFVLCARLAGDTTRLAYIRALASGGAVPLAVGVYLSFSRGALAALAAGLLTLIAFAPTRAQLRAVAATVAAGAAAAAVAGALDGFRSLQGSLGAREAQGAAMLAVVALLGAAAAVAVVRRPPAGELRLPRRRAVVAACAVAVLAGIGVAAALERRPEARSPAERASTARLGSLDSNRYSYWDVALEMFADEPLRGEGSAAFATEWRRKRNIADPSKDAHSLYLETAAELGIVGVALLALLLLGVVAASRRLYRRDAALAAGAAAALVTWAVHAGLDWDWEMPALTLIAIVLAGAVIAWSESEAAAR
jgi:hypothetical protein